MKSKVQEEDPGLLPWPTNHVSIFACDNGTKQKLTPLYLLAQGEGTPLGADEEATTPCAIDASIFKKNMFRYAVLDACSRHVISDLDLRLQIARAATGSLDPRAS